MLHLLVDLGSFSAGGCGVVVMRALETAFAQIACQRVKNLWQLWISLGPRWACLVLFIGTWCCTSLVTQVQCFRCLPERHPFHALKFLVICSSGHIRSQGLTGWLHQPSGTTEVANCNSIFWHQTFYSCLLRLACPLVVPSVQPRISEKALR